MAAKKDSENFTHSQIHGGDFVFDFCCTPCDKRKLNREATKYCVNCSEYFCVQCVESHKNFKALSGHVLVDPNSTTPPLSRRFHAIPTELCKKHQMKLVDMYCAEEDVVGCSACFLLDHKSCPDIHYIPEYIQSSVPTVRVDQINRKLTKAIKEMGELKTKQDNSNENLDKSKANCKKEIQKYKKEINHIIDKIEVSTLALLDARHKYTRQKTAVKNQNIHDLHTEMVRLKSEIESDQSNDCQKFVSAKLSQCVIMQGEELQSELSHDQTTELKFTRNTNLMTFLSSIATLGMLSPPVIQDTMSTSDVTSGKQPKPTNSTTKSTTLSTASGNSRKNKPVSTRQGSSVIMKPQKQGIYKIVDKSEYKLKQPDELNICNIFSSCIIDSDNILFVDNANMKLKLVDSKTYTVKSSLELDYRPWSVCRVSSMEALVCLNNNSIQFISTLGDKLASIRLLSMKHVCRCIAVIRDKMYVCDDKAVYIYTLNGKLEQTISKDKSRNAIFSFIWDITVSDDEQMMHVTDTKKGVITLDTDGYAVWRYSGTDIREPRGVCTDGNGNVIVCGYNSNDVIQLSPDGQYMGQIATRSEGVLHPQTVSYDRHRHKLIIGNWNKNIIVFTVQ